MKRLAYTAFVMFLASALTIWLTGRLAPDETPTAPDPDRFFSMQEVALHDQADDCWKVIDGVVYDFTAYIPLHPTRPRVFTRWCGQEASEAYHTKSYGEPHSAEADALLLRYRIGVLAD